MSLVNFLGKPSDYPEMWLFWQIIYPFRGKEKGVEESVRETSNAHP